MLASADELIREVKVGGSLDCSDSLEEFVSTVSLARS